jgi:hypothetical protein
MLRRRSETDDQIPFPTRQLQVDWMPGDVSLHFSADALAEPYIGVVPESLAYRAFISSIPNLSHPLGVEQLTRVNIIIEGDNLSPVAQTISANRLARIEWGFAPLMILTFDGGKQGKTVDVRPTLPLILVC